MANKYSRLSDFEINELILEALGIEIYDGYQAEPSVKAYAIEGKTRFLCDFDFCNGDNDTFKLMIDNKITLKPVLASDNWHAISSNIYVNRDGSSIDASSVHKNPCRAIAECYLLMKDAEKDNG